jgi:hypothetical protein
MKCMGEKEKETLTGLEKKRVKKRRKTNRIFIITHPCVG